MIAGIFTLLFLTTILRLLEDSLIDSAVVTAMILCNPSFQENEANQEFSDLKSRLIKVFLSCIGWSLETSEVEDGITNQKNDASQSSNRYDN